MPRKKYAPEEIVAKLRQVDLVSQGQNIAYAIRQIGVSEVTYYRWQREYRELKTEHVKHLNELETENTRLRKAVSRLMPDKHTNAPSPVQTGRDADIAGCQFMSSRPEEFHPRALPDPCMNLSIHTAPDVRPPPWQSCQ